MIRLWSTLLLPVALGIACGGADHASPFAPGFPSGSGGKAPATGGQGGEPPIATGGAMGGSDNPGGQGGEPMGGEPMGGMGASPDPGCPSDDEELPDEVLFACPPPNAYVPSDPQPLSSGTGWLVGVTPDELVAVWGAYGPAATRYFLAERGSLAYAFGERLELTLTDTPLALSPDGLRLILASNDGTTLKESSRGGAGELFGVTAEGPWSALNDQLAADGDVVLALALSHDDKSVAYLTFDALSGRSSLRVGTRATTADVFSTGSTLSTCETSGDAYLGRTPVSFSPDGLTLFYYDAARTTARAAYRASLTSPFVWFRDLPTKAHVSVNSDCSRAYLGSADRNGPIVVADIEY